MNFTRFPARHLTVSGATMVKTLTDATGSIGMICTGRLT
jgi:hypothetical protein